MFPRFLSVFFLILFLFQVPAGAGSTPKGQSFAVLPFALHGPQNWRYLQDAVPEMLGNRLTWPGHFIPVNIKGQPEALAAGAAGAAVEAADKLRKKLQADYLIWGALSIVGESCSLDIQTLNPKGEKKPFSSTCKIDDLIGHLEKVAHQINSDIFSRPTATQPTAAVKQPLEKSDSMPRNQAFIYNEASSETALNPALRYEGDPRGNQRWRTQSLNFPSRGMLVGDADGNGQKEIFLLKKEGVDVYRLQNNRLVFVDEFSLGPRRDCLNINFFPGGNGTQKIAVSATLEEKPASFILSFANGKLSLEQDKVPYFLNVIKEPPLYMPVLFGQKKGVSRFLDNKGVVELILSNQELVPGRTLNLPEQGNIFNVAFLPDGDKYKLIVADKRDKLKVFNSSYELVATTDANYAASGTGIEYDTTFAGGTPNDSDKTKNYFIPTRLAVENINGDTKHELLVARNISAAAQFFPRYRDFPQSEIHYLAWDGIGLSTVWKTRRIKGTTIDYVITELGEKKEKVLLVCVNTHPGSLGVRAKKTVLLGYPLQISEAKN